MCILLARGCSARIDEDVACIEVFSMGISDLKFVYTVGGVVYTVGGIFFMARYVAVALVITPF